MMNLIERIQFIFARSAFAAKREEFYVDLSEAIRDRETLHIFLTNAWEFSKKYRMHGTAQIMSVMLVRFQNEEGRLGHMLKTIVPNADLMTISAIDGLSGNSERADGFLRLARQIERSRAIKGTLIKALLTSFILLPVIAGFAVLNTKKIPAYESMVPNRLLWPQIGQILGGVSDLMLNHASELGLMVAALAGLLAWSFRHWCGSLRSRLDQYLPYSLYRDMNSCDFLLNMAGLLRSGKQLVEALHILGAQQSQVSPWLRYHISTILQRLNVTPDDYARAFDTGLFSPAVHLRLVTYGRRDKNFAAAFIRLGSSSLDYVHSQIEKAGRRLSALSVTVSILLLGFFYFGDYLTSDAIGKIVKAEMSRSTGS